MRALLAHVAMAASDLIVIACSDRSFDDSPIRGVWQGNGFAYGLPSAAARP